MAEPLLVTVRLTVQTREHRDEVPNHQTEIESTYTVVY